MAVVGSGAVGGDGPQRGRVRGGVCGRGVRCGRRVEAGGGAIRSPDHR